MLLTPSYNKGYLMDLGLTLADEQHLLSSKKHLAPTVETDAEAKYNSRWAEYQSLGCEGQAKGKLARCIKRELRSTVFQSPPHHGLHPPRQGA